MPFRLIFSILILLYPLYPIAQLNISSNLERAQIEINSGKNEQAIERLNRLIKIKPDLFESYFLRGIAKFNLSDFTGSVLDFTKTIDLNPFYPDAIHYRGIAYNSRNDYHSALNDFDRAIQMDKSNPNILINRGLTKISLQNYTSAIEDFDKAILIRPGIAETYIYLAVAQSGLKQFEKAIENCNKALSINMFSSEAYLRRAIIFFEKEDYKSALDDLNKTVKLNNKSVYGLYIRAITNYHLKYTDDAIRDYSKLLELDPYNELAWYNRAMLYLDLDKKENALSDLEKVNELNPNHLLSHYNKAVIKTELNRNAEAIDDLNRTISLYPEFAEAYYLRHLNRIKLKQHKLAEKDRQIAVNLLDRQNKDTSFNAFNSVKYKKLIELNAKFNSNFANSSEIYGVYSGIDPISDYRLFIHQNSEKKNESLVQITDIEDIDNFSLILSAEQDSLSYIKLNINELTELLNVKTETFSVCIYKGIVSQFQKDYNAAIEYFDKAIHVKPKNEYAYLARANARKNMFEFIESLDEPAQLTLYGSQQQVKPGREQQTDYSLVFDDLNKALEINPLLAYAHFNKANLNVKTGKFEQAKADYQQAIKLDPEFANAWYNLALVHIHLREFSKACIALSKSGEYGQSKAWLVIKRYCTK